jgi:hypothetical protein
MLGLHASDCCGARGDARSAIISVPTQIVAQVLKSAASVAFERPSSLPQVSRDGPDGAEAERAC